MKRNKLLLLLVLLMTAATGATAQEQWDVVWDFTAWSTETVTALKADAAASKTGGWSDVEKAADAAADADPTDATKDNCFWSCSGTVNADGNLSANGVVIKEFQGLKFNSDYAAKRSLAIAVNYPSTTLGDYAGGAYLWLGGSKQTCFTIPGVKAGSKITIEVESNKTSSARGIGLYKNSYAAENLIGEQFTPTVKEAKTWDITEDCDVVVYNTNSCHIYTIKVKAPSGGSGSETQQVTLATNTDQFSYTSGVVTVTVKSVDGSYGAFVFDDTPMTISCGDGNVLQSVVLRLGSYSEDASTVTATPGSCQVSGSGDGSTFVTVTGINQSSVTIGGNLGVDVDQVVVNYTPAASAGYTVSLKDGVKDADNWTITPNPAEEGQTVTLQYNGRLKVKGVKATSEAAKPDLLPAVFTVDAGKTVKFSKGNLQATYNGSNWIWGFAEHQWDYIGNAAGNTSINGNGTVSANGTVDLFGWVGASSTWTGAAQYGISNSTATNNVDGYGNVGGEAQKVGWGATVGAGWRTLTKNEWLYLLSERATGVTVNSTDNARYTQATINTDGTAVKGLIIFPDSYAGGSPAGVTWGTINAKSTFETTCTSAGWTALEAAGCVFLPAAGYRQASNVTDAGIGGGYWSSSSSTAPYAFALYFESDYMTIQYGGSRKYGFSVRLVRDAN